MRKGKTKNKWITLPKRDTWKVFTMAWYTSQSPSKKASKIKGSKIRSKQRIVKNKELSAWDEKKVISKTEVAVKRRKMKKSRLRETDGPLSLEEHPCETPPKKKVRIVLWENNVKDEEGYGAIFTEQGASASQVAATKFLDTISKLLVWLEKQVTQVFQHTIRYNLQWTKVQRYGSGFIHEKDRTIEIRLTILWLWEKVAQLRLSHLTPATTVGWPGVRFGSRETRSVHRAP